MDQHSTWNDELEQKPPDRKKRAEKSHEEVFRMWEAGIRDLQEIGTETGYTQAYVRLLLQRRGYEVTTINTKSKDEIEAICKDYKNKAKVRDILRKHNISNNTLYSILQESGVPIHRTDGAAKEARKGFLDRAIEMYLDEYPIKEIHAETGITAATLYQELADRDLDTRSRRTVGNSALNDAVEMYQNKRTLADIQYITGVIPARLYRELEIRGVEKRKGTGLPGRIAQAVEMYKQNKTGTEIYKATRVSSAMLYRVLRKQAIPMRQTKEVPYDEPLAVQLYEKGTPIVDVLKQSQMTKDQLIKLLIKRGQNLRTGLPPRATKRGLDLAVQMYQNGEPYDNIEVDTFITRVVLLTELKKRQLEIRP